VKDFEGNNLQIVKRILKFFWMSYFFRTSKKNRVSSLKMAINKRLSTGRNGRMNNCIAVLPDDFHQLAAYPLKYASMSWSTKEWSNILDGLLRRAGQTLTIKCTHFCACSTNI
jgi:hypothetical protein